MTFKTQTEIHATIDVVWKIMLDVENWRDWTSTITSIQKINTTDLQIGTKLLIAQPELPIAVWKVFEIENEKGFSMSKGNLFLKVVAGHKLEQTYTGTIVELSLVFSGLFGTWVAKKYQAMMEEYLSIEAVGLKNLSEFLQKKEMAVN